MRQILGRFGLDSERHLDIESIDALIDGLKSWKGGVLAVTHDAALVDALSHDSEGIEQPLYYWFPSVAVSGLTMYTADLFPQWQGDIFIGTMSPSQGKFLVRLEMDGERVLAEEHLLVDRDRRVRDIAQGADGALYVLTDSEDNTDLDRHFPGEVLRLTPR